MQYVAILLLHIQLITIKLCTKFQNHTQVVAEKSLTEICPYVLYKRERRKK